MAWYVIRTNIKCEDKAERNLRAAGFRTYAPWQRFEKWNRRKNRHIVIETRLAPRYLFLDTGDLPTREIPWGIIRDCEGVEHVLGVDESEGKRASYAMRPIPLNNHQTEQLMALMKAETERAFDETRAGKLYRREIGKTKKETTKMRFPPGTKVKINDGPFFAFPGEVTNVNGRGQLEVLVSLFGRLSPVELEPRQVDKVADAA